MLCPNFENLDHRWQTQGLGAKPGPVPCFIQSRTLFLPSSSAQSLPLVKEQLYLHSPKIIFGPLKATARLMWSPVKMSLTLLIQMQWGNKIKCIEADPKEKKNIFIQLVKKFKYKMIILPQRKRRVRWLHQPSLPNAHLK